MIKTTRIPIPKKMRFEIFKRDIFKCQYCGRTPPAVVLEVDHIIAKASGGADDINNYITACFDCNRGKGKIDLKVASNSLADHFEEVKERREQLRQYSRLIQSIETSRQKIIQELNELLAIYYPNKSFSEHFNNGSLKIFLSKLPAQEVKDALSLAACHFPQLENIERAMRYFCGVCWNRIKNPESRDW